MLGAGLCLLAQGKKDTVLEGKLILCVESNVYER